MNYNSGIMKLRIAAVLMICALFATSCHSQEAALVEGENTSAIAEAQQNDWTGKEVNIKLDGGSGKATILSPVHVTKEDGKMTAVLVWSSKNYDYIIVDGVKYLNENPGGESTFTIPVKTLDEPLNLIGDTVAMSTPHEIEYILTWNATGDDDAGSGANAGKAEFGFEAGFDDVTVPGLAKTGEVSFSHAKGLKVEQYGAYAMIRIAGSGNFLLVPEGAAVPDDVPAEVTILQQPFDKVYEASTSVMDLLGTLGCLDAVRFSGQEKDGWMLQEPARRMEDRQMLYAGKYRAPDYELLLSEGCDLAIENTMIAHEPEIREKLTELGIPVLIETSSYEMDPLGRLEWIRLYGILFGREDEANRFFDKQRERIEAISKKDPQGPVVACFYVSESGEIHVRKPADYISDMIERTGGRTIFTDMADPPEESGSSLTMQTEDFYAAAHDADIIVYNSIIGGGIDSVDALLQKNALFRDFKAIKEGRVYCMNEDFFQHSTGLADFMEDLHAIFTDGDRALTSISKLQ